MKRRSTAAAVTLATFVLEPGLLLVGVPFLLTGWQVTDLLPYRPAFQVIGAALVLASIVVLGLAVTRFVIEGVGTPAPMAPPTRLVRHGIYARVRNPMYIANAGALTGQFLILGRPVLLVYLAVLLTVSVIVVRKFEEPALRRQFGAQYDQYRASVPSWQPRLRASTRGSPR